MKLENKGDATSGIVAVVVAAGIGSRMNGIVAKQYLKLGNPPKTMLEHAVATLDAIPEFDAIVVAVRPDDETACTLGLGKALILKTGGKTRRDTVLNTLREIARHADPSKTLVLVHDAARALVPKKDIQALIQTSREVIQRREASGAVLAMSLPDTVKRVDSRLAIQEDIDRGGLVRIATPQAFRLGELIEALDATPTATDESSAIRAQGKTVRIVKTSMQSFKITEPDDLECARALLSAGGHMQTRIGIGYDSHRLTAGRKLIIGGVTIDHFKGLDGHSDADLLAHATIDAILGAAGLGNIGLMFPDSDSAYKDADSIALLHEAARAVYAKGWRIVNIDAVLIAQQPKLNPHIDAMKSQIAAALAIDTDVINIKPKTNEKLGFEGREEGMSAQVVALIERQIA